MSCYPRLLIISNECISNVTSNGRTLRNFLIGWPVERIAQFHVRNVLPDDTVCQNYYYVSDRAAVKSFLCGNAAKGKEKENETDSWKQQPARKGKRRNAVTMMVRNFIWNSMRWAGTDFYRWIEEFAPEVLLLQAGDCAFMLRLARKLAQRYQIPLVIYNSEGYYFSKSSYFRSEGIPKLAYPLFHRQFCAEFEKTVKMARTSVYCCEKLKNDYDMVFGLLSEVIYTATQLQPKEVPSSDGALRISYLGNLGVGRHESLVDIGNALQAISRDFKLDVYGNIPNEAVKQALSSCAGIRFRGFISYEEVQQVMHSSDILIHAESFSDFYRENLKYAFSTKIADSLASGNCFFLYAPENMACSEYLRKYHAAWVVTEQEQLLPVLKELCRDPRKRFCYTANGQRLAAENHNCEKNAEHFRQIICGE